MKKPTDKFSFDTPLFLKEEGNGMLILKILEVRNFDFKGTNNKEQVKIYVREEREIIFTARSNSFIEKKRKWLILLLGR